jgi:hypothetical protein
MEEWRSDTERVKPKLLRKNLFPYHFVQGNLIWSDLGSKPIHLYDSLAVNNLIHAEAISRRKLT